MAAVRPFYQDPFSPVLFSSPALVVSDEQKHYIREILDLSSSDSRFAEKAYIAITLVLTKGNTPVPTVTSLVPGSTTIGDPSFDIHVHGTGFTPGSIIIFNGFEEPTTYVSSTELTTGVNMDVWAAPATVPVGVLSGDGVFSATQMFVFQDAPVLLSMGAGTKKSLTPEKINEIGANIVKKHDEVEKGKK